MNNMLPCFPSFRELFISSDDDGTESVAGRDPLLIFETGGGDDDASRGSPTVCCGATRKRRKATATSVILKLDAFSGALLLPQYQSVRRDSCPLLRHCWNHNWEKVVDVCALEPHRSLHKSQHSGRTALHLASFNCRCPLDVAQALLTANRHMVLVQDANRYTPLHLLAFFQPNINSLSRIMPSNERQLKEQEEEQSRLVELFCDTAIMVEQELQNDPSLIPPAYGTSPLFLAAKRNAPLSILQTLLHTRQRTGWIAPSTGGEPYWDCQTQDEYSSPLEVLLRDSSRASEYLNADYLRSNRQLRERMRQLAYQRLSGKRGGTKVGGDNHVVTTTGFDTLDERMPIRQERDQLKEDECELSQLISEHQGLEKQTMDVWEKCIELLMGHCPLLEVGDDSSHIPYGVLHAVTSCKVPIPSLVQVATILFPEQALQRDEQGFIPLHHVLRCNHKYATSALLNILLPGSRINTVQASLESTALMRFPNDGPTPLAYALLKRLPVDPVIDKLLCADSDMSLHTMDPSTCLYPFCLAALKDTVEDVRDQDVEKFDESVDDQPMLDPLETDDGEALTTLTLSFRLLRMHPQVLAHAAQSNGCTCNS